MSVQILSFEECPSLVENDPAPFILFKCTLPGPRPLHTHPPQATRDPNQAKKSLPLTVARTGLEGCLPSPRDVCEPTAVWPPRSRSPLRRKPHRGEQSLGGARGGGGQHARTASGGTGKANWQSVPTSSYKFGGLVLPINHTLSERSVSSRSQHLGN